MTGPTTKSEWRHFIRASQRAPAPDTAATIQRNLIDLLAPVPGLILFYRAMAHEVPLEPVADELGWTRFAVTRTPDEGPLTIHPAIGAMEQHGYGFAQPVQDAMELAPHHISAAVVPAMAFDRSGHRLGHGAGYFDELLARIPVDRPRIGVTVAEFLVGQLPVEPHDVSMTHIVTENEILTIEPPSPWSSP